MGDNNLWAIIRNGVVILLFVIYQVWEGLGVVATGRQMLGETDPVSGS